MKEGEEEGGRFPGDYPGGIARETERRRGRGHGIVHNATSCNLVVGLGIGAEDRDVD